MILRCGLFGLTLMLGVVPRPVLAGPGAPERGAYGFEIVRQPQLGTTLPMELREPLPAGQLLDPAAPVLLEERTVTIEWTARERPGLLNYRVTALIDGGPLSGVAARWDVAAGSVWGPDGMRTYRVRLPIPLAGSPRVRAAIEAFGTGGTGVVLGVRSAGSWHGNGTAAILPFAVRELVGSGSGSRSAREERRLAVVSEPVPALARWARHCATFRPGDLACAETTPLSRGPPAPAESPFPRS